MGVALSYSSLVAEGVLDETPKKRERERGWRERERMEREREDYGEREGILKIHMISYPLLFHYYSCVYSLLYLLFCQVFSGRDVSWEAEKLMPGSGARLCFGRWPRAHGPCVPHRDSHSVELVVSRCTIIDHSSMMLISVCWIPIMLEAWKI